MTSTASAVRNCSAPATHHAHSVLVVDDEPRMRAVVVRALRLESIHADEADGAAAALAILATRPYDLVILDLLMPGRDGFALLGDIIGRNPDQPVLVLSCLSDAPVKIRTLNLGADDYLSKPFHVEELRARVRARLRRHNQVTMTCGRLTLDLVGHGVDVGARHEQLTEREFQLLHELMRHPGEAVTKQHLLAQIWAYDPGQTSNVVDVCVRRLRSRLGDDVIETVRGEGYRVG